MRYSAAYPTGAERCHDLSDVGDVTGSAILSSEGCFSMFKVGGDTIRFATSPRLVRYTRVKRWEDGYLEVGVDCGIAYKSFPTERDWFYGGTRR